MSGKFFLGKNCLLILDEIARNAAMAVPVISRWRTLRGRTSVPAEQIDENFLQHYAYSPYETIIRRVGASGIEHFDIGEIGPGDHIPTALLYLCAGAASYTCYDRFPGNIAGEYAKSIYKALIDNLRRNYPEAAKRLMQRGIEPNNFPEACTEIVHIIKKPIENVDSDEYDSLDLLASYNVVEHLCDLSAFAEKTLLMLRPGGLAIHRVDLGPHGKWEKQNNSLEWLTIPDSIWSLMSSKRGMPNRWRFHEIRARLMRAGFEVDAEELEYFDESDLELIRPSLIARIREMPDASLRVKTACFCCRKPSMALDDLRVVI